MFKRAIFFIILTFMLSSCGTIFKKNVSSFHERSDKIDYYIFALDSFGLVFLLVPGIVALSVDYITGAIFLTKEEAHAMEESLTQETIRDVIFE